jgi:pimeloyl-ACP methyl ester carboxylesterase
MWQPTQASKFVTLPGGAKARYVPRPADASLPILILLHGGNCSLESWDAVADRLQGKARIISLDLPGHGLTGPTRTRDYSPHAMTSFLDQFIGEMHIDQPVMLAGHSMGGHVAWRYALSYPQQVSKLVLVAPGGLANPTGIPGVGMRFSATEEGRAAMRAGASRERMEAGLRNMFTNQDAITPELVDRNWTMASRSGALEATMSRFQAPMFEPAAIARLGEITQPTLAIWGAQDNVFALKVADTLQAMPRCRLVALDGCGHFPQEEQPERVADQMASFLRT